MIKRLVIVYVLISDKLAIVYVLNRDKMFGYCGVSGMHLDLNCHISVCF